MEPVEITAGRLHLRPWRQADLPVVVAALSDAAAQRWMPVPVPYDESAGRRFVDAGEQGWADRSRFSWAVCESTTGDVLGSVSLRAGCDTAVWDVGYWTTPDARGRGVASEALGSACRWAFAALDAVRLEWMAPVGNWASRRAAEKAGFRIEGLLRAALDLRGERVDAWIGGRLPGDADVDTAKLPSYEDRSDGLITLRRWRSSDAADVARACDDTETARWLPVPVPYAVEAGRQYVDGVVPAEWSAGTAANVAVVDAVDGRLLGAVGLRLRDGIGEVGYWTAPWARGRGVAPRAVALHAAWGAEVLGLRRIELLADVDNLASQRVAEKAGWTREGVARSLRPAPRDPSSWRDMVVYAQVR